MEDVIKDLIVNFHKIKNKKWIKGANNNKGSIGETFEILLNINNNDFEIPDYNGIELKTKSINSESAISLFNCTPTGPHYREINRLKDLYGYPDKALKEYNVLNASILFNKKVRVGRYNYFELKANKSLKKIFLLIYDKNKVLIEDSVYWDFDILKEKLERKLKYLALIKAYKAKKNNDYYFKYNEIKFFKMKKFDAFINLLETGKIIISVRAGIYKDLKRLGKIYDHGTSFKIYENDLEKLYDLIGTYK